jgi:hypothetical protein
VNRSRIQSALLQSLCKRSSRRRRSWLFGSLQSFLYPLLSLYSNKLIRCASQVSCINRLWWCWYLWALFMVLGVVVTGRGLLFLERRFEDL